MDYIDDEKIIIMSFDWEEVNSAVFKNAQIYKLKKDKQKINKVAIIVPENFSYLYKDADIIFSISQKTLGDFGIETYRDILEYNNISENILAHRMNRLLSLFLNILKNNFFNNLIGKFYTSTRQKRFYIKSGLEKKLLKMISKIYTNTHYIRTSDFYDIYYNKYFTNDLGNHFTRQFNYLYEMINDGNLYESKFDINILERYPQLERIYNHQGKKIILRTRNFKNKATIHNSKPELLLNLVLELLKQDESLLIVNLGLPILSLNINCSRYLEVDHNMSFSSELSLCQEADFCIMTAEAGLFTAFSSSNINIIQYDNEWSMTALKKPISLFEARKNIEMNDLDIRDELKNEKYNDAATKILTQNNKVNQINSNNQIKKFEL